jgi:arsenate reductase
MLMSKTYNVLFLCTGNSARSVMAEAALNALGKGRFKAYSAGSFPAGKVNPFAAELLEAKGYETGGFRSKSWDEFAAPGAPHMDFIFTVCDNAAGEACPVWPGHPATAHWGFEDPAAFEGADADKRRFFERIYQEIVARLRLFLALPLETIDGLSLQQELHRIGKTGA